MACKKNFFFKHQKKKSKGGKMEVVGGGGALKFLRGRTPIPTVISYNLKSISIRQTHAVLRFNVPISIVLYCTH